jgi:endonuclease/exonuclease/phosphatase family metal-dependent hydrolase
MQRLVSWNVLADSYIRASFYPRADPALLRPGARTAAVIEAIAADPAEVFCLQEVEPRLVDAARAKLVDWEIRYAAKPGRPDGCAIVARPGVVLENVDRIVFADGAPDRDDSGHVALLATLAGVRIATTHLRWDPPGTPAPQRWALREVRELLGSLHAPAIVCGDLNFEADDDAYRMLIDAGFVDPHAAARRPTCNPNGRAKRIDFILCTVELVATSAETVAIDDATVLPSATMPSDHVPIAVAFAPRGFTTRTS